MTARATTIDRLSDMVEAGLECMRWAGGLGSGALDADRMRFHALSRLIIVIGEAASHVPPEQRSQMSAVPWRRIVATRNLFVHQYWMVDPRMLLATIQTHIPQLISAIEGWRAASART